MESFILLEPYWALRTGAVPFWMKFNMEASAEWIEKYLVDEIYLMLFNHGVEAVGLPPLERWRGILACAKKPGQFVGVREDLFPRDFGSRTLPYESQEGARPLSDPGTAASANLL